MMRQLTKLAGAALCSILASSAFAWDHPSHMITAVIAFAEVERAKPELIEKIGMLMLKHPDPAPFWVAAGEGKGTERARRMFIEASRWSDDARWTIQDRPAWHSARWAIITDDAPPKAKAIVEARGGRPAGQALESLALNAALLANPEAKPDERALALSWLIHVLGDIHQPFHVSDLYSKEFPSGNLGGSMGFVGDPMTDSGVQLHLLWDSNYMRSTELVHVDEYAREIMEKHPRTALSELTAFEGPDDFEKWARESHQIAIDWAFDIEVVPDPEPDPDKAVQKMMAYILDGVSPVKDAPEVPAEYWEKVKEVVPQRLALAGYRLADIILAAADRIAAERSVTIP